MDNQSKNKDLQMTGAGEVVTLNTVKYISNRIDLTKLIVSSLS